MSIHDLTRLEPRSVIVFKNDIYANALHGLDAVEKERCKRIDNRPFVSEGVQDDTVIRRGVRVSITFRMENTTSGQKASGEAKES